MTAFSTTPMADPEYGSGPTVLSSVQRFRSLVAVMAVIGLALGGAAAFLLAPDATASADVYLRDPTEIDPAYPIRPVGGDFGRFVGTQAQVLQSVEVIAPAAESLGMSTDALKAVVSTRTGASSAFVKLAVEGPNEAVAAARRAAVLDAYGAYRISTLTEQLDVLAAAGDNSFDRSRLDVYGTGIASTELESDPGGMSLMGVAQYLVLGTSIMASLGMGLAWVLNMRSSVISRPEDVAATFGIPLVGSFPATDDGAADSMRSYEAVLLGLEHRLSSADGQDRHLSLLLPVSEDSMSVNLGPGLAVAAGAAGFTSFLVDVGSQVRTESRAIDRLAADNRRPDGLTNLGPGVMMYAPEPNQAAVFLATARSDRAQQFASYVRENAELGLFDCPPVQLDSAAMKIAGLADNAILVVRSGESEEHVAEAVNALSQVGLAAVGYVYLEGDVSMPVVANLRRNQLTVGAV